MLNLSHSASGSEIPEAFAEEEEEGKENSGNAIHLVIRNPPLKERILECLREAGGDSLSASDLAEEMEVSEKRVQKILTKMSQVELNSREVFEDENEPGSYFLTDPLLEKLAVGF